jgi:hypothetical protein
MAAIGALPHVEEAFQELERLLNLRRNSLSNEPAIRAARNAVYQGLSNAIDISGTLVLDVEADSTRLTGSALHGKSSAVGQVFGALFHHGLRKIRLQNGLTAEEWDRFLALISQGTELQAEMPGGIATALWKEPLPHLLFDFARRRRLLIEDDPDEVERDQRRVARIVTEMVAVQGAGHARLAASNLTAATLGATSLGGEPAIRTLERFVATLVDMVEADEEGQDTEILQRATLNVARESFRAGELRPILRFFDLLKAPAEEGKRAQAIRRERLATLLGGACCDPHSVAGFSGKEDQYDMLTTLLQQLGFDAVTPYLSLLEVRPEPGLAQAVAQGLGVRLNSAAADLRTFLSSPATTSILSHFLEALSELEPSPQMITVLEALRTHQNLEVVEAVADLLSRAVSVNSLEDARRLLNSKDSTEQRAGLRFFRKAGGERAAQTLVDFLNGAADAGWDRLALRRAYACLGSMRSHHGHDHLKKILTATGLTGRLKSTAEEQILAVRGLVSADDRFGNELLDAVMSEKQYSGKVRLALTRMRGVKA